MQLAFLLAVAIGFSSLHHPDREPLAFPEMRTAMAVIFGVIPLIVAAWFAALWRHGAARVPGFGWLRWSEQILAVIYLVATVLLFLCADLGRLARVHWRLDQVIGADELVVLAALVLPLLPGWCAVERARAVARGEPVSSAARQHLRGLVVIAMFPALAICLLADVTRLWLPAAWQEHQELLLALSLPALVAAAPWYLRHAWPAVALPPGLLRAAIEQRLAEIAVPVREILCWKTQGRMANVAIAGILPRHRFLFLADGLWQRLTERQILVLVEHELAHCRLRHLPRLALSLAAPIFLLLIVGKIWPSDGMVRGVAAGVPALGLAAWAVLHGRLARAFEVQADWEACVSLAGDGCTVDENCVAEYVAALQATNPGDAGDWLHPALVERAERLFTFQRDSESLRRWQQGLQRATVGHLLALALLAAIWAWI